MLRLILIAAALALATDARAANPCGGGGNGRQGGPARSLFAEARGRVQERRAARGCQPAVRAFPAAAAPAVPVSSSCPGGVCPVPTRR